MCSVPVRWVRIVTTARCGCPVESESEYANSNVRSRPENVRRNVTGRIAASPVVPAYDASASESDSPSSITPGVCASTPSTCVRASSADELVATGLFRPHPARASATSNEQGRARREEKRMR